MNDNIKRERYMKKLRELRDEHIIKVIVGVRRCGKSILLEMFRDELSASGVNEKQLTYINFEEPENIDAKTYTWRDVYDRIRGKLQADKMNYVFLDEVQNVPDFERMVDGLYAKKNVDLYVTGSNARFMSSRIATLLSGRHIEIKMLPFSFAEYVSAYENPNAEQLFQDYLNYGAFPQAADFVKNHKAGLVNDYLTGIYNTVVIKDVMTRQGVSNTKTAANIMRFMLDNIGNMTSPKGISDTMTADNQAVSRPTVVNYLTALAESFLIYPVMRFDVKGKKLLQNYEKYYTVDAGLRKVVLGSKANADMGRVLENIVYLELLRRENIVRVGRAGEKEIDFVIVDTNGNTSYYQVALTVREEKTLERELSSLRGIDDSPKYLLTLDPEERNFDGIRQINAIKWLLGK
ncbi:MAG: ATP-binding protein [Clostridiales Family XIII bacterium]|jgi:predicted AAA+ superfamily ATPase|nr:ATP-binding protein [Clostridiales Family XIII bacterium]